MTALSVTGLVKAFGRVPVLRGVDLHVPARSLTAVLGPSGCGKTTLLRLVAGFDTPDSGTVALGDRVVAGGGRQVPAQHRRVGYVPQEGALFPHLDVQANITFGLPRRERRSGDRVEELLGLVGLDRTVRTRQPHQLSGGQQQRVALARALAPRPALVLLDEPFASLDAGLREETASAVAEVLRTTGATAVLVTHDQDEALSLADQVAVMREGRIVQVGPPSEVYGSPVDPEVASFVGSAVVLPAVVGPGGAVSALGLLPVPPGTPAGPGRVLLRPEQVVLGDEGVPARVTGVGYHGHDATVRLALLGGECVTSRVGGRAVPAPGDHVRLSVRGQVRWFAAAAGSACGTTNHATCPSRNPSAGDDLSPPDPASTN